MTNSPAAEQLSEREMIQVANSLVAHIGTKRFILLAQLLEDVKKDTRYGHISIVVVDGRVRGMKAEKSYE
jgi:hypothetical protein